MEEDYLNYLLTVKFRGTPCTRFHRIFNLKISRTVNPGVLI